ncbi:MAG: polysaccharide deacetylase family protein [Bacteroidales bacterium]|jgi:peptidoglycan/xylan/chitin deacetylase (PgdA/CDA1 family)|nr:polysaccharide deacetylase family protein [Bacteroidales bacterium]
MIRLLTSLTKKKIIVPFYHTVAEQQLPHIRHLYRMKTVKEFLKDLEFLLKHFEPIDVETLYQMHIHKTVPKKPVFHLTFDDGMKEMHEIVSPILLKKGIPATFFINSGFTDNKALFYRHRESLERDFTIPTTCGSHPFNKLMGNYAPFEEKVIGFLHKEKPYLTTKQIKTLSQQGFSIGAHSVDHPYYNTIPLDEQLRQTRESLVFISSMVTQKLRLFAFPFTDYKVSKQFFEEIEPDVDLCFGTAGLKNDEIPFNIQRIAGEKRTYETLKKILGKEYLKHIVRCIY